MSKKALFFAAGILLAVYDNIRLSVSRYEAEFSDLPEKFDGFKIVQISDLHNQRFGRGQSKLVSEIKKAKPDIIVITGDLFHTECRENVRDLLRQTADVAPVYYVAGNHEQRFSDYFTEIVPWLKSFGVRVIDDKKIKLRRGRQHILLIGLADPTFKPFAPHDKTTAEKLERLVPERESGEFSIVLSHRPELFPVYAKYNIRLVFSGHAHGGQLRFPFTRKGLFAVDQGWFPAYTEGIYEKNGVKMLVSRGLGNSTLCPKINDAPELVVVTLKRK